MKLGIIGCGMIVNDLYNFIGDIKSIEVVGIASRKSSYQKVKEFALKHYISNSYETVDELLLNKEIDTIYIATNNHTHYELCKKALNADKHVICEKPFTVNVDELKELAKLSKQRRLILLEAITTIHLKQFKQIQELLTYLGKIKIISMNYSQYSSRYNDFKEGIIKPAFDNAKAGGALYDLNIYNLHFICGLFGKPMHIQYYPNIERNIDTSGILTLTYQDKQAILIGAKDCKAPIINTIQGDKGSMIIESPVNSITKIKLVLNNGETKEYSFENQHRMYDEFLKFDQIIQNKDYNKANELLNHSVKVMELLTKARKSANLIFSCEKAID